MKRQIKFRGKTTVGGIWAYGSLLQREDTTTGIVHCEICNFLNWDVDPETVGQFTGLLDKDGKEIYEGDLVSFSGSKDIPPLKVVFRNGAFGLYHSTDFLKDIYGNGAFWGYLYRLEEIKFTVEVIGNIHDNPDLFK